MKEKAQRHTTTITEELQERLNRLAPNEKGLNAQIKRMARDLETVRMKKAK